MVLLEDSPPEEAPPTLSAITLPRLDGGRGGVDETALFDWDFKPSTEVKKFQVVLVVNTFS